MGNHPYHDHFRCYLRSGWFPDRSRKRPDHFHHSAGGNGFTAIIVAWLAKFNTFYMALISFLLIFLSKGAAEIASAYSLNDYAASIIEGVILFFILGSEFFINYKMIFRGSKKEVH